MEMDESPPQAEKKFALTTSLYVVFS